MSQAEVAGRIRAARAYADLNRMELARSLGVSAATLSRLERPWQAHTRPASRGELVAIAVICGVPVDFMLHGWEVSTR